MQPHQFDLFLERTARVYTDGVHLTLDYADWIVPAPSADHAVAVLWDRFEAVHSLARSIGLRRHWFQNKAGSYPHYDLTTPSAARRAVEAGALLLAGWKDYARLVTAPGSRLRPIGWVPAIFVRADAIAAVEERNLRLMTLFAPGRRVGARGGQHIGVVA